MDAMVTARMPEGKKLAGAETLRTLGITASQLINDVWDYLIAHGESPLHPAATSSESNRQTKLAEAQSWVDSLAGVGAASRFSTMEDDEIAREHYVSRGYMSGGAQ